MNSQRKRSRKVSCGSLVNMTASSDRRDMRGRSLTNNCDQYLEVMCLTKSQEVLKIHLPPGVEHNIAVVVVEDILEVS